MPSSRSNPSIDSYDDTVIFNPGVTKSLQDSVTDEHRTQVSDQPLVTTGGVETGLQQEMIDQQKFEQGASTSLSALTQLGAAAKIYSDNMNIQTQGMAQYLEDQTESDKKNLDALKTTYENRKKMTEINNYYSDRYESQSNIMKKIAMISILLLISIFIKTKKLIPANLANAIIILIIILGGFYVLWQIIDFLRRDNTNYDEYKFPNMPEFESGDSTGESIWDYNKRNFITPSIGSLGKDIGLGCIGEDCCSQPLLFDNLDVGKEIHIDISNNQNVYSDDDGVYQLIWVNLPKSEIDPIEAGDFVIETVNAYKDGDVRLSKLSIDPDDDDENNGLYVFKNQTKKDSVSMKYSNKLNRCVLEQSFKNIGQKGGTLGYSSLS